MNASQGPPITAVKTPPVADLPGLRELHSALLQRTRAKSEDEQPAPGEMLGFIRSARDLGALLEDLDSRETAQGLLDFWAGRLLSVAPQASDQFHEFVLLDYKAGAAVAVQQSVASEDERLKQVCEKSDAINAGLDAEGRSDLNRLLLELFRLKEGSTESYPNPLAADGNLLKESRVKELAVKLEAAGLLRRRTVETGEVIELTSPRLLALWDPLQKMVVERRALRQLAMGWKNSGEETGALLGPGEKFTLAEQLPGLDAVEIRFLKASRKAHEERLEAGRKAHEDRQAQEMRRKDQEMRRIRKANTRLVVLILISVALAVLAFFLAWRAGAEKVIAEQKGFELEQEIKEKQLALDKIKQQAAIWEKAVSSELERFKSSGATAAQVEAVKTAIDTEVGSQLQQAPKVESVPTIQNGTFKLSGPAFILHPETDSLVGEKETMALVRRRSEIDGSLLIAVEGAQPTDRPLFKQLNPNARWVTAGWNYGLTNRQWLLAHKAKLVNKRNGKQVEAQPVDWGNRSGHVMNISPGVANALGMQPGDEIELSIETQPPLPPSSQ